MPAAADGKDVARRAAELCGGALTRVNAPRCSGFARGGAVCPPNSRPGKFPASDILCIEAGSRFAHAGCGCGVCMPIEIPRKRECFFPNFSNAEPGNRLSRQADSNYNGCVSEACKGGMLSRRPNSDPGPRFNGFQKLPNCGHAPGSCSRGRSGPGGKRRRSLLLRGGASRFFPGLRKLRQGRAGNWKTGYSIIRQVTPWGSSSVATLT